MTTVPTQIRIDADIKKQSTKIFKSLGMDLSSAINIFLSQSVLRGGLPFSVELPHYNKDTLAAMAEARKISRDPDIKGYNSLEELKAALDKD